MYSAIKMNGKKLYDIARKGGEVERKPRSVTISKLELLDNTHGDWQLDVVCSKGTYIRTLCHDIGQTLGVGGVMSSLRRMRAGQFSVTDALTLEQVQAAADQGRAEELLLPIDTLFSGTPALTLDRDGERRCRNGNPCKVAAAEGTYRIYGPDGGFLALSEVQQGICKIIKSFFEV